MNTAVQIQEVRIKDVTVTEDTITAQLVDGRTISVPLAWSWRLSEATPKQRSNWEIIGDGHGVHWPDIDEDISAEGMLYGIPAPRPRMAAKFNLKSEQMDEIIQKLTTPEECMQLAIDVRDRNPDLARKARRRAVELRAASHGIKTSVELELLKALYAYEEVLSEKNKRRTRATRTWQMIDRHGIIGAAERAVNRKIEATGYKVLVAMGLHDLTFEAVIVRHHDKFSQEVVARAKERLGELEKI